MDSRSWHRRLQYLDGPARLHRRPSRRRTSTQQARNRQLCIMYCWFPRGINERRWDIATLVSLAVVGFCVDAVSMQCRYYGGALIYNELGPTDVPAFVPVCLGQNIAFSTPLLGKETADDPCKLLGRRPPAVHNWAMNYSQQNTSDYCSKVPTLK